MTGINVSELRKRNIDKRQGSKGFHNCFSVTRLTMRVLGLWSLDKKQTMFKNFLFIFPVIIMTFFVIIPQSHYAVIIHRDLNLLIEVLITIVVAVIISLIKMFAMLYNKQVLKKLLTQIYHDWRRSTGDDLILLWKNGRISKIVAILCISTTLSTAWLHLLRYYIRLNSIPENSTETKPLYLSSVFPFDTHYSPMYEFICTCQFLGVIYLAVSFSSYDGLFVCSVAHFSSQLKLLRQRVSNTAMDYNFDQVTFVEVVRSYVREHQHIIHYTDIIENNFNKIFLAQIVSSSIALCLQGYQFVMATSEISNKNVIELIFSISYLICNLLSLFMHCYFVEILRNESEGLFYAVYNMQWYNLPPKESRLTVILMNRFSSPIKITVGKFSVFSLEYFTTVIKTSVGYISVLLAIRQKQS